MNTLTDVLLVAVESLLFGVAAAAAGVALARAF